MSDIIVLGIIVLIVALAAAYVIKAKKSGKKCIGCPDGDTCGGHCASCSSCSSCSSSNTSQSHTCGCHISENYDDK